MMFEFTTEQIELRRTLRAFLTSRGSMTEVRRLMESATGADPGVWRSLSSDLGLTALAIPERFGGIGATTIDLQIVMEELGRALYGGPLLTGVAASSVLLASGDDDACSRLLPSIAQGTSTLALADGTGTNGPLPQATGRGGAWSVTGEVAFVVDGHSTDQLLVIAEADAGVSLFLVDGQASGLTRIPMSTLDETRKQAIVTLSGVSCTLIGPAGSATDALQSAQPVMTAALVAETVGTLRRMLELSVEYAGVREQFGRPIGSFQAVQHKCVDMLVDVETSTSAAYAAGWAIDENSQDSAFLVQLTRSTTGRAAERIAAETIQVHGGIGFTWEHDAHLFYKRAISAAASLGPRREHEATLAALLGFPRSTID